MYPVAWIRKQLVLDLLHHGDTMNLVISLEIIGYVEFKYPDCMTIPDTAATTCTQLSWLKAGNGFKTSYRCTSTNNLLKIDNLNGNYPDNISQLMVFYLKLATAHSCGKSDYVGLTMKEDIGNRALEYGAVISIC